MGPLSGIVSRENKSIIVWSLISQSPLMKVEEVQIPKMEKVIVDLVADDMLFAAYQAKELRTICENISDAFIINQSTLKRYAPRRNKWDGVKLYFNELEF
jgi:hypothetical protein